METYQIVIALALLMLVLEMLLPSFLFAGFAVGFLALVPLYYLGAELSPGRDIIIFAAVSFFTFFVLRRYFKKTKDVKKATDDVNQY